MFTWPQNAFISRPYDALEKQTPYFQDVQHSLCRHDVFRDFEYPAALAAMGVYPDKKYLCIGGFGDALAVWLSHLVKLQVIDRVSKEAVRDYPLSYGAYWHTQTEFIQGDWCEIANDLHGYDIIFSVGSIEHNSKDRDILFAWQLGRHLSPGGKVVLTTEWSEEYANDEMLPPPYNVVGGHIYDLEAIQERIVKPSGLEMTEWQERPVDWKVIEKEAPFIGRSVRPFCPALIVLER